MTVTPARPPADPHGSDSLSEPVPASAGAMPGIRLTPAFIAEAKKLGSRCARLAILDAYERTHGDDWCLRVTLVGSATGSLRTHGLTRGLLELDQMITGLLSSLTDAVEASIEIRPEPTATRRPSSRTGRDVVALSRTVQRPDSIATGAPSIVEADSPSAHQGTVITR